MILYVIQVRADKLVGKLGLIMMEIVYHTFCCFNPQTIFTHSTNLKQTAQKMETENYHKTPCRNSRFMPFFSRKSKVGVTEIFHSLETKQRNEPRADQQLRPVRNAENKKVKSIQRPYVPMDALIHQF